jgi:hypothetical protein
MVWNQYVWEATVGTEAYMSDDDDQDTTPLSFEDWELQYDDVLRMMWNTMRTLFYDAHITHQGTLNDFSRFCYTEHDPIETRVENPRLFHVWQNVRRIVNANGLHEEMMRGAAFGNFVCFCEDIILVA